MFCIVFVVPFVQISPSNITFEATNTTVTVNWNATINCDDLNGFLYGYKYELISPESDIPVQSENTDDTTVTFNNLVPASSYQVKLYIVTSAGFNVNMPTIIGITTKATSKFRFSFSL